MFVEIADGDFAKKFKVCLFSNVTSTIETCQISQGLYYCETFSALAHGARTLRTKSRSGDLARLRRSIMLDRGSPLNATIALSVAKAAFSVISSFSYLSRIMKRSVTNGKLSLMDTPDSEKLDQLKNAALTTDKGTCTLK